jgi:hypothetical protein
MKKTKLNADQRSIEFRWIAWIAKVPHSQLSTFFEPPICNSMNKFFQILNCLVETFVVVELT